MKKLISLTLALILVLACLAGVSFAADAEATWTDGLTTVEGSLLDMVKQASEKGGTVTLLQDMNHSAEKGNYLNSNSSFTLDLNGHTIRTDRFLLSVSEKATGITVIKNGTLISDKQNVTVKGGGLQMDGVTAWSGAQNVSLYTTEDTWNKDNLIENCTLANNAWGAFSFNNTAASMAKVVMTIKNTTLATSKSNALVLQTNAVSGNVVLGEGMKIYAAKAVAQAAISLTGEATKKAEGTHSVEVAGQTLEGLTLWTTPATATKPLEMPVIEEEVGTTGKIATWTDGLTTMECTLKEVSEQVKKAGGTVVLNSDIVSNVASGNLINTKIPFTLDLNGHTITCKVVPIAVTSGAEGITIIKNGTIISDAANVSIYGGLILQNVTGWSNAAQNINYYETSDKYNRVNLIENCTFGNTAWGAMSFNLNKEGSSQEKASMTIKNSTMIAARTNGSHPLVHQTKGITATYVLGEGVKLYSYKSGDNDFALKTLNVVGEAVTKSADKASATILDQTFDMMTEWTTPETGSVDLDTVIVGPEAPAIPETPTAPATPSTPAEPSTPSTPAEDKKDEGKKDEGKQDEGKKDDASKPTASATVDSDSGAPVGLIIGIVAAVVVLAAVAVIVLKKKKK